MVYKRESVSTLGWVEGACQGLPWSSGTRPHTTATDVRQLVPAAASLFLLILYHMASATLPQLTPGHLVRCWEERSLVGTLWRSSEEFRTTEWKVPAQIRWTVGFPTQ